MSSARNEEDDGCMNAMQNRVEQQMDLADEGDPGLNSLLVKG